MVIVGRPGPCRLDEMLTRALVLLGLFAVLALGNCVPIGNSAAKTEQSITASCVAWEDRAKKAAHPDAEMIARHDQLMAKAAAIAAEAGKYDDPSARHAAIEREVEAKMEAESIYDWRHDLEVAANCWKYLALAQEDHREQQERLARLAEQLAAQSPPSTPSHSSYSPKSPNQLAASPAPMILSPAVSPSPQRVPTWGETSCAPMIPPVMRDQPVTNVNPMIPPACR
jgi:hypothetical protein